MTAWIAATIKAQNARDAEALSDALLAHGALSVSMEDADAGTPAERAQFGEPGSSSELATLWARSRMVALFEARQGLALIRQQIARACSDAKLEEVPPCMFSDVAEQDWVALTQSQFTPICVDQRLWIVPSWHQAPDADAINIRLDPGMAFGTGSHATTRLCLQWLLEHVQDGSAVLDYGCGSGILAIAAARLGATRVCALDIDDKALEATQQNAQANGVQINIHHAQNALEQEFDCVVANILTNPLCLLAPTIAARLAAGGVIALAGVLREQRDQVIAAWRPYVALQVGAEEDGWVRLEGRRPA